jgi:quinoprotein glucose dehydrogenase
MLLLGFVITRGASVPETQLYTTWSAFGGSVDSMQYSALRQINKTNVSDLQQVWFYPATGTNVGRFSFSPLVVDGVMYVGGKDNAVVAALDAATGKEIWTHPTDGRPTDRGYAWCKARTGKTGG